MGSEVGIIEREVGIIGRDVGIGKEVKVRIAMEVGIGRKVGIVLVRTWESWKSRRESGRIVGRSSMPCAVSVTPRTTSVCTCRLARTSCDPTNTGTQFITAIEIPVTKEKMHIPDQTRSRVLEYE